MQTFHPQSDPRYSIYGITDDDLEKCTDDELRAKIKTHMESEKRVGDICEEVRSEIYRDGHFYPAPRQQTKEEIKEFHRREILDQKYRNEAYVEVRRELIEEGLIKPDNEDTPHVMDCESNQSFVKEK